MIRPDDRLRAALNALHWSQRDFAAVVGRDERTVRRWASGEYSIPPALLAWLEAASAWMRANPPPGTREASGSV